MSNPATEHQQEDATPKSAREKERENEFREAVNRVYKKYGNNLSAFLRDIQKQKELVKRG
jgi:hypothetical protein